MLYNSDSNYHEGTTLSLSPPMCLTTHTVLFSLLINTLLDSLLPLSVGILFCKAEGTGWALSLTTGLATRIQLSPPRPDLILWWGTETPLQAEATGDHRH